MHARSRTCLFHSQVNPNSNETGPLSLTMHAPSLIFLSVLTAGLVSATPTPQEELVLGPGDVETAANLTALADRKVTCVPATGNLPTYGDCVNALVLLPFDPTEFNFNKRAEPKPNIPFGAPFGTCVMKVNEIRAGGDDASWLYAQVAGGQLLNSCRGSFSQNAKVGGNIIFGKNGNLKMEITRKQDTVVTGDVSTA